MEHSGHSHGGMGMESGPTTIVGTSDQMINLNEYVDINKCEVLNNKPSTYLKSIITATPTTTGKLCSDPDVDAQLIIKVQFRETVKIRGFKLQTSNNTGNY